METPYKSYTITVGYDDFCDNPRKSRDNILIFSINLRNYCIGDNSFTPYEIYKDIRSGYRKLFTASVYKGLIGYFRIELGDNSLEDAFLEYLDSRDNNDHEFWLELLEQLPFVFIRPIYAYIHSGIRLKASPFSCSWDSGLAGFAWAVNVADLPVPQLFDYLNQEINDLDAYLNCNVFQYCIRDENDEVIACGGGYESEETAIAEAKLEIDNINTLKK